MREESGSIVVHAGQASTDTGASGSAGYPRTAGSCSEGGRGHCEQAHRLVHPNSCVSQEFWASLLLVNCFVWRSFGFYLPCCGVSHISSTPKWFYLCHTECLSHLEMLQSPFVVVVVVVVSCCCCCCCSCGGAIPAFTCVLNPFLIHSLRIHS